jgi:hypothetical protein
MNIRPAEVELLRVQKKTHIVTERRKDKGQ